MMRLTDVVKNLIILNVAIHLIFVLFFPELKNWLAFHYPGIEGRYGSGFEPFQIITHMFAHDGYSPISTHLLFNMVGLYFLDHPLKHFGVQKSFYFIIFSQGLVLLSSMSLSTLFKMTQA